MEERCIEFHSFRNVIVLGELCFLYYIAIGREFSSLDEIITFVIEYLKILKIVFDLSVRLNQVGLYLGS